MKRIWKLTGEVAKKAACREILAADEGHVVTLAEPNRTLDQNAIDPACAAAQCGRMV